MNVSNNVIYSLLQVVVILLIGFALFLSFKNRSLKQSSKDNSFNMEILESKISNKSNKEKIQLRNNLIKLNGDINLVNLNGDTIKLGDVIDDRKLIFRYSKLNCGACINKEFENIQHMEFNESVQKQKIIFIAFYQELRDLIVTARSLKLEIPILIIPDNNLGLPVEKQNLPFYFVIDKDLVVNNVFIPVREDEETTYHFLSSFKSFTENVNLDN